MTDEQQEVVKHSVQLTVPVRPTADVTDDHDVDGSRAVTGGCPGGFCARGDHSGRG